MINLRDFRFSKLNTSEFSHLMYVVFWPIFGIAFGLLETGIAQRHYYPVECIIDAYIPFCELFLIPYMFWFLYLVGMAFYGCLIDPQSHRRFMYFIMFTYTFTIIIYMLFPTCQNLRPATFPRDNALTRFIAGFYEFDTNTNVCPSIHVLGAVAVLYGSWKSKHFSSFGWRCCFSICTLLICASTVFMKQHSIIDVVAAGVVCLIALPVCRYFESRHASRKKCKFELEKIM